jgi:error-prone DNA polymerase
MLLEDETGTINLVVPPAVYERHRLTVRTEPLVLAAGRLERHPAAGGGINVLVERLAPLEAPDRPSAEVRDFSLLDERERARRLAEGAPGEATADEAEADEADFRAVAPAVMSFASGRRR